jgi:hypothetical protein
MNRRSLLANSVVAGGGLIAWLRSPLLGAANSNSSDDNETVTVIQFSDSSQKTRSRTR